MDCAPVARQPTWCSPGRRSCAASTRPAPTADCSPTATTERPRFTGRSRRSGSFEVRSRTAARDGGPERIPTRKEFAAWCRMWSWHSRPTRARPPAEAHSRCWLVTDDPRGGAALSSASIPLPVPSPLTEPFWAAVRHHRLEIQRCRECGGYQWTPQMVCGACLEDTLDWTAVSGLATVYSFTIVRRPQSPAFTAPYVVAEVDLDE